MQKITCAWSKSCEHLLETTFILHIFNADGRTLATKKEKILKIEIQIENMNGAPTTEPGHRMFRCLGLCIRVDRFLIFLEFV
jgi:hypothetical protein